MPANELFALILACTSTHRTKGLAWETRMSRECFDFAHSRAAKNDVDCRFSAYAPVLRCSLNNGDFMRWALLFSFPLCFISSIPALLLVCLPRPWQTSSAFI